MADNENDTKNESGVGGILHAHVFGIPIWVVAIVGIAGFILVRKMFSGGSASTSYSIGAPSGGGGNASPYGGGSGSSSSSGSGSGSSTSSGGATALETWIANAQSFLTNIGYDPAKVNQALQDYLAGQNLSSTDYAIISAASKGVGTAPGLTNPSQVVSSNTNYNTGSFIPKNLNAPIFDWAHLADGSWLAFATDGGVFAQNGANFHGSAAGSLPTGVTATGVTVDNAGGYTITFSNGSSKHYGP